MTQKVTDVRGSANENIVHAAQVIGRSKVRRAIFEAIYHGKKMVKTVDEIMEATGFGHGHVLTEAKRLADNEIVKQEKRNGRMAYRKDNFYTQHKKKVLALVDDPSKKKNFPTKQEPRIGKAIVSIPVPRTLLPKQITIDDVESFKAVKGVQPSDQRLSDLPEERAKRFLQKVIGETNDFQDWGGERNDLYTNKLRFRGKRRAAAFALKGKATTGVLKPVKLGKNGDQLQRLFTSPAELFFVVYHSKIDESVAEQMQALASSRALSGARVYYCLIDGQDLSRLVAAYPAEFEASAEP